MAAARLATNNECFSFIVASPLTLLLVFIVFGSSLRGRYAQAARSWALPMQSPCHQPKTVFYKGL
jgi:hypothetical protein